MVAGTNVIGEDEITKVLCHYPLAPLARPPQAAGGTANANWKIDTLHGSFFLKKRNPKYAAERYAAFDHALMEHLMICGVPAPRAVETKDGTRWLPLRGSIYELFAFQAGEMHDPESLEELSSAGAALGRFHAATARFDRPDGKDWPRYDSPQAIREGIAPFARELRERLGEQDWDELQRHIDDLDGRLTDACYHQMPKLVIHGDYHPGNLKFTHGQVAGIFDLDWATYQPRVKDIADGVFLFAGRRSVAIDPGDIVSLTQTWTPSPDRAQIFMEGYLGESTLTQEEMEALPLFVKARWLFCRVAGMSKVAPERRISYFLDGLLEPLRAIDESGCL